MHLKTYTIVMIGLCMLLAGCSKLTADNYSRLKIGMKYEEVKTVIGSPRSCNDTLALKQCSWEDGSRSVDVGFVADQVVWLSANNLK